MLSSSVRLHDIEDVEAFVVMCVKRSGCSAGPDQWEDLVAEGMCLLYHMASAYQQQLPGHTTPGRFSGYAITWLPKQISQSWHKGMENHLYLTNPTTKSRGWSIREPAVSYSEIVESKLGEHEASMRTINDWVEVPKRSTE